MEVTPCLNKIIESENNIYAPRILVQTKGGRSSDSQLLINTGLLPINTGIVFSEFNQNQYYSLAKALNINSVYKTFVFIGNQPSFWHQGVMNHTLGFDSLISSLNFDMSDVFNMGLSDESFFKQSIEKIKTIPQPFYIQMITLSSHFPFTIPNEKIKIRIPVNLPKEISSYLQSINYVDNVITVAICYIMPSSGF